MKVAVYNRYWTTAGGAERYAGAVAQTLAAEHDVDLLTPEPVDWPELEERLGLDLSAARPVFVEDAGYGTLASASAGYGKTRRCRNARDAYDRWLEHRQPQPYPQPQPSPYPYPQPQPSSPYPSPPGGQTPGTGTLVPTPAPPGGEPCTCGFIAAVIRSRCRTCCRCSRTSISAC